MHIRRAALVVLLGAAPAALADEVSDTLSSALEKLHRYNTLSEFGPDGTVYSDTAGYKCWIHEQRVMPKLDEEGDPRRAGVLRRQLKQAEQCRKTNAKLFAESQRIAKICVAVGNTLDLTNPTAPPNSEAGKRYQQAQRSAKRCIELIEAFSKKAEAQLQAIERLDQNWSASE